MYLYRTSTGNVIQEIWLNKGAGFQGWSLLIRSFSLQLHTSIGSGEGLLHKNGEKSLLWIWCNCYSIWVDYKYHISAHIVIPTRFRINGFFSGRGAKPPQGLNCTRVQALHNFHASAYIRRPQPAPLWSRAHVGQQVAYHTQIFLGAPLTYQVIAFLPFLQEKTKYHFKAKHTMVQPECWPIECVNITVLPIAWRL